MTEAEIQELFDQLTGPIPNEDYYKAISPKSFNAAVQYIEQKAFLKGMEEGMDRLANAVETGLKASAA